MVTVQSHEQAQASQSTHFSEDFAFTSAVDIIAEPALRGLFETHVARALCMESMKMIISCEDYSNTQWDSVQVRAFVVYCHNATTPRLH